MVTIVTILMYLIGMMVGITLLATLAALGSRVVFGLAVILGILVYAGTVISFKWLFVLAALALWVNSIAPAFRRSK
jgi:hypothetical protein